MNFIQLLETFELTLRECPTRVDSRGPPGGLFLGEAQGPVGRGTRGNPTGAFPTTFPWTFQIAF